MDSRKRLFEQRFCNPGQLFGDMFDLSRQEAFCYIGGQRVAPRPVHILLVGFSCKTVSFLQTTSASLAAEAIRRFKGSTGQT
eukprot:8981143-Lingulodinium_polyedra.AAC.1